MWDKVFYTAAFLTFGTLLGYSMSRLEMKEHEGEIVILELKNHNLEMDKFMLEYQLDQCNMPAWRRESEI